MSVHSKLTDSTIALKLALSICVGLPLFLMSIKFLEAFFAFHPTLLAVIVWGFVAIGAFMIISDFLISIFKAFIQPASLVFLTLGGGAIWFVGHFLF